MNNILTIDSVSKHYGNFTALNDVSIKIPEGSIFGLLGPNGAGKTTLIRIINQITRPDSGRVLFNDIELKPDNIKDIGLTQLPQAMPEECKVKNDPIQGYKNYYINYKNGFANWKNRTKPEWYKEQNADIHI